MQGLLQIRGEVKKSDAVATLPLGRLQSGGPFHSFVVVLSLIEGDVIDFDI